MLFFIFFIKQSSRIDVNEYFISRILRSLHVSCASSPTSIGPLLQNTVNQQREDALPVNAEQCLRKAVSVRSHFRTAEQNEAVRCPQHVVLRNFLFDKKELSLRSDNPLPYGQSACSKKLSSAS